MNTIWKEERCRMQDWMKRLSFYLILALLLTGIPINTCTVQAGSKKYVKKFVINTSLMLEPPGKTMKVNYTIKVKGGASKKITVRSSDSSVVTAKVKGKKIIISTKKAGYAEIKAVTKARNKKGKKLSQSITVRVIDDDAFWKEIEHMFTTQQATTRQWQQPVENSTTWKTVPEQVVTTEKSTMPVTTERISTEYVRAENVSTEQVSTERRNTEWVNTEWRSTEQASTERGNTEWVNTEWRNTERERTEHRNTERESTEHRNTEWVNTEWRSTELESTEHRNTEWESTGPAWGEKGTTENIPNLPVTDNTDPNGNGNNQTADAYMNQYVDAVISSEAMWMGAMESLPGDKEDRECCWFQDFDMDGKPEFVVGGHTVGLHASKNFHVYQFVDGSLKRINVLYEGWTEEDELLGFWKNGKIFKNYMLNSEDFQAYLYWDARTGYHLYSASIDGYGSETYYNLYELIISDGRIHRNNLLHVTRRREGLSGECILPQGTVQLASAEDVRRAMETLFQGKERRKLNTGAFLWGLGVETFEPMYGSMNEEEKRQALISAYQDCYVLAGQAEEDQELPLYHLFVESDEDYVGGVVSTVTQTETLEEYIEDYLYYNRFFLPANLGDYWNEYVFYRDGSYDIACYSSEGEYLCYYESFGSYDVVGDKVVLDDGEYTLDCYMEDGILLYRGASWEDRFGLIEGTEQMMNADLFSLAKQVIYETDYVATGTKWFDN